MLKTRPLPVPTPGLGLFLAALVFQTILLVIGPAQQNWVFMSGREVTLKTSPVDPFDPLRGYYVTLGYDISTPSRLPGYPTSVSEGQSLYVVLEVPETAEAAWKPVRVDLERPDLDSNHVAIKGRLRSGRLVYGIETYYIPEDQRTVIERDLQQHATSVLVDAKVDATGQAAPIRLRIQNRVYEF